MDTVLTIAEIILFLSVSVLCIYLVKAIEKITETISNLEKSVKSLQSKLDPVLENLNGFIEKANNISESVHEQLSITKSAVQSFKDLAADVLEFERNIKGTIEKPIQNFLNLIFGFITGLKSFTDIFSKKKE